jgi:alkylation response protein AidB-like acyl-CoA dehydrogenase|tara:strand:- start:17990 stop:19222 length:1233 start_codon:yes stop_codon:yes gene_type:complete
MEWNTEQLNLKSKYYTVGQEIVRPSAAERDATVNFDRSLWKKVGNTGLFGLCMPEEYGGAGLGIADFGAALEGFSAGCQDMGVLVTLVAQVALVQSALVNYGTKEQCQTWLPELISGEKLACFAITEKGCGSDVRSIKTQVDRTDSGYILNGKKWNITNAPVADICMTFGKVVGKQEKSIACFIFNTHSEGIEQSKPFDLMGNRGTPIGSIDFENVALTNENRIGQEEEGLSVLYFSFLVERVLTGILVSGCIAPLIQESVAYSQNRQAFGKAIGDNQYVQQYIVDIESKLELLKGVIFRALSALEKGEDCSKLASIVKMFSAEIFHESSLSAMRVMGNYGYRRENYYERLLRDAIGLLFAGGTAEIHKRVIWDSMVKEFNNENKKRENLKMNWNNAVRDAQETKELEEA